MAKHQLGPSIMERVKFVVILTDHRRSIRAQHPARTAPGTRAATLEIRTTEIPKTVTDRVKFV